MAWTVLTGCSSDEPPPTGDSAVEAEDLPHFSFFVTSLNALQELSGSPDGFGGDLRYGETGPGAGLRGADKICAQIAEMSMPGSSAKQWRAFLSVAADDNGQPAHAIERIGEGPWYDRLGRTVALTRDDLLNPRPENASPAIREDLPNEDGVPNHQPDPNLPPVDNHHMLTGSGTDGQLHSASATCQDWTTADGSPDNGRPRSGLAWPRALGGQPPGGGQFPRGTRVPGGAQPPPGAGLPGGQGSDFSSEHWISALDAPGCAPGVGTEGRPPAGAETVGSGGGYGGFYCFALNP